MFGLVPISYNKSSWSDCSLPWLMPDIHVNSASLYSYSLCKCWKSQGHILKPLIVFQDMEDKISPVLDMKGGNMSASHRVTSMSSIHPWLWSPTHSDITTRPVGLAPLHYHPKLCSRIQYYFEFSIFKN